MAWVRRVRTKSGATAVQAGRVGRRAAPDRQACRVRARQGYVTKARQPRARSRAKQALPRPVARGTVLPNVQTQPRRQALPRPQLRHDRSTPHDHVRRRTRHPTLHRQVHPACDSCAAAPTLSRHHQQQPHPNHPASHHPRPTNPHRPHQNPTLAQALTHLTQLRSDDQYVRIKGCAPMIWTRRRVGCCWQSSVSAIIRCFA